jgi:hypothetical protein
MRTRISLMLVAALLLTGSVLLPGIAGAQGDTSQVTVVHGVPDLTVDVYVDDELTLEDFEPGEVAGPLELPAATYNIKVRAAGADADSDPALEDDIPLPGGVDASIVAHLDGDGDLQLSAFVNDLSEVDEGDARVTVRHTAAAPTVDVRAGGAVLLSDLANPDEDSADVPAGTYTVEVVPAGESEPVVIGPADLTFDAATHTVVYAIGSLADDTLGVVVQTFEDLPVTPGAQERTSGRLAGPHRFATAVTISQRAFPDGADVVYLARADIGVDALAGGTLTDGPILLVPSCEAVPEVVKAEIRRLDPSQVLALGGTAAICDATLQEATRS